MNKLFDTRDKIDFGQMNGEYFYWIYRLAPNYLKWLIENTSICFIDLKHFYSYGKPFELSTVKFGNNKQEKIFNIIRKFGKNNSVGNSESYLITINVLNEFCKAKLVNENDFMPNDFTFTEELIAMNAQKLKNSNYNSNYSQSTSPNRLIKDVYQKCLLIN